MKALLISIAVLFFTTLKAQIKLKYYFIDACTDTIFTGRYNLLKSEQFLHYHSDGPELTIDSSGLYIIDIGLSRGSKKVFFSFLRNLNLGKSYADTIIFPKLASEAMPLHTSEQNFYYCSDLANGHIEEFYKNGKLRCSGDFKKGKAYGVISYFNMNGIIVMKRYYKKGSLRKTKLYNTTDTTPFY